MLSLGNEFVQLDAGYRDQWLSPMIDSSMLISTEAPTMPSLTLSNQMPIGGAGFEYQLFLARMSYSKDILWDRHITPQAIRGCSACTSASRPSPAGRSPAMRSTVWRRSAAGLVHAAVELAVSAHESITSNGLTDSRFANRSISMTSAIRVSGRNAGQNLCGVCRARYAARRAVSLP